MFQRLNVHGRHCQRSGDPVRPLPGVWVGETLHSFLSCSSIRTPLLGPHLPITAPRYNHTGLGSHHVNVGDVLQSSTGHQCLLPSRPHPSPVDCIPGCPAHQLPPVCSQWETGGRPRQASPPSAASQAGDEPPLPLGSPSPPGWGQHWGLEDTDTPSPFRVLCHPRDPGFSLSAPRTLL